MRPCNQTKDWSVSLFGDTLPKFILYGNVNKKFFTCDIFTGKVDLGRKHTYIIKVRNVKRNVWETRRTSEKGLADIFLAIEEYCKNNTIYGTQIEVCHHKTYWAEKSREAHEKYIARGILRAEEESREIRETGPQEKRANYDFSLHGAWGANNSKVGRVETDKVFTYDAENCHPYSVPLRKANDGKLVPEYEQAREMFSTPFEMGQNTSGNAGKYSRSGFETRDGMNIKQNKIRPEALKKPDYMKRSGQPSGISMDKLAELRYEKAKAEIPEGMPGYIARIAFTKEAEEVSYYEHNYK